MFQKLPQKHRRPSSRAYCPVALDQQLKERFPQRLLLVLLHEVSVISVVENGTSRFAISQSHSTSSTRPRSSSQV